MCDGRCAYSGRDAHCSYIIINKREISVTTGICSKYRATAHASYDGKGYGYVGNGITEVIYDMRNYYVLVYPICYGVVLLDIDFCIRMREIGYAGGSGGAGYKCRNTCAEHKH
jgi:hypothetical protein